MDRRTGECDPQSDGVSLKCLAPRRVKDAREGVQERRGRAFLSVSPLEIAHGSAAAKLQTPHHAVGMFGRHEQIIGEYRDIL
jgi:hypothetical protein